MASARKAFCVHRRIWGGGIFALTGCSSNADSNPSQSATPTPTQTSASPSPTASPTKTSSGTTYTVKTGSFAKIAGQGGGTWPATGGKMVVTPSGSGALAGLIEVAAKGRREQGDWILNSRPTPRATCSAVRSPHQALATKVTGAGGRINYLTVQGGTTLVTEASIPVQNGTAAPTTMALSVIGAN